MNRGPEEYMRSVYPPVPDGHVHDWQVTSVTEMIRARGVAEAVCLGCSSFDRFHVVNLAFRKGEEA